MLTIAASCATILFITIAISMPSEYTTAHNIAGATTITYVIENPRFPSDYCLFDERPMVFETAAVNYTLTKRGRVFTVTSLIDGRRISSTTMWLTDKDVAALRSFIDFVRTAEQKNTITTLIDELGINLTNDIWPGI